MPISAQSSAAVRGSTSVWLATTAGALLLVGLIVFAGLSMVKSRSTCNWVECDDNLRQIAQLAILYADAGHEYLPFSEEGGLASLQILIDFHGDLGPALFICRGDRDGRGATPGPDGICRLTPETCSYEYAPVRLTPEDDAPLAWCRAPFHDGGRNVVSANASVRHMTEAEFRRELAKLEKLMAR